MKNTGISKVIKISKKIILITLIVVAVIWIYKMIFTTNVSYDNLTRITNVKEMVRLNSLKVMDEFVYKDTIDDVGVVYNIKANIIIGFDLDSLKYKETDGVLEIELPNTNVISIYSEGEDLLDNYDITYGDFFGEPDINSEQWQIIRSNIKEYIKQEKKRPQTEIPYLSQSPPPQNMRESTHTLFQSQFCKLCINCRTFYSPK